eukprot:jgi/Undpi1/4452/HiC_scaffold_17.g07806.m1
MLVADSLDTSWMIASALMKRNDPDTSLILSNTVYDYPDVWVCLFENSGCDGADLQKDCAASSTLMEERPATAVFYPNTTLPRDKRRKDIPGVTTLTDLGWCVVFSTSEVTEFRGEERDPDVYLDYFLLDMYWYPGGSANASTTCVPDGEEWDSHKEWVYVYLHDPIKNTTSPGMQISYSCMTSGSTSHVFTTMGIGLTEEINLEKPDGRSYKALSTSTSNFKVKANRNLASPYAYLSMEIEQEQDSLKVITEINPLDVAEMLGNIGGFWDLILLLWPIFFVAATRENPTLKPRNLKKSVQRVGTSIGFAASLKRSSSGSSDSSRCVHPLEQPGERPYWESHRPAYKSARALVV